MATFDGKAKFSSIVSTPALNVTGRNAQSLYQQSDIKVACTRRVGEIPNDAGQVIVIQYGSRNLKVGFAKDAMPRTIPHVIAHRTGEPLQIAETEVDVSLEVQERLEGRYKNAKRKPPPNIYSSLVTHNKSIVPQVIPALNDAYGFEWARTNNEPFITGNAALRINPTEGYTLRWPIKKGNFNHKDYPTYMALLDDLDRIWSFVIKSELKVKEFQNYGIVLVVPDAVTKVEIASLTRLILHRMSFKSVAFLLESVSGTFGTGTSAACVLDIGAQSTKVTCIEDGQVLTESKSIIPYGGDELTRLLSSTLKMHYFPYTTCDLSDPLDLDFMDDLKIRLCTVDEEDVGNSSMLYEAYVRRPGKATLVYPFKVFEERIIVPSSLFEDNVPLLSPFIQVESKVDRDFFTGAIDGIQETVTSEMVETPVIMEGDGKKLVCKFGKCKMEFTSMDDILEHIEEHYAKSCTWRGCTFNGDFVDELTAKCHFVEHICEQLHQREQPEIASINLKENEDQHDLLSITQAIVKAIISLDPANGDKVKKFLSSILVIGSGHRFPGFLSHLQETLRSHYPTFEVEYVLSGGKDSLTMDVGMLTWKGGAVFSKLECITEAWITLRECENIGITNSLRNRLFFSTN